MNTDEKNTNKFKEYDVVISLVELEKVPKGTKGTLLVDNGDNTFEAEFVDEDRATLNILTVQVSDIKKW